MIPISTTLEIPLPGAGGRGNVSPPAIERPPSPKLGNFSSIFDDWPGGLSSVSDEPTTSDSGDPVKFLQSADSHVRSSARSASNVPRGPAYSVGFLSGLDFSTIESPSRTPDSLLLDTISEDESGQDDDDKDEQGDVKGGVSSALLSGRADLFTLTPEVVIASASTSPSASLAAVTAKAVAAVASVSTPTRPIAISRSPKRTPAHAGSFGRSNTQQALLGQYDLLYPLGSVPTPMIPSAPLALAGSPMLNHPIQPLAWYTKEEKLNLLELKLKAEYKRDRSLKFSAGTDASASDARSSIHVFVDLSNIVIGFYNRIRADRSIPQEKKMKAPPFFFEAFARILERDRKPVRRVTAGSAPDSNNRLSWPLYMRQADALGYEMNILSRVTKSIPSPRLRPSNKYASGYNQGHKKTTSRGNNDSHMFSDMYSSDDAYGPSSPPPPSSFKLGEQGVDEILHLKMCQSLLDHDIGTIVLATGDAAEAEFSDGFLKHAERALKCGWCVELLSWKMGISNAWRELERKQKGTGLFRIIELDKYSEDLLDMSIE
ncbi:hypothetical protein SBRCBS47491_006166 [Sporothrix bragantina]|uniref:NYN domain-containing protein n=1 Tax=Sporothrix bragantina TaxID=671064 RepID=A0ABP0C3K3_9PEZI